MASGIKPDSVEKQKCYREWKVVKLANINSIGICERDKQETYGHSTIFFPMAYRGGQMSIQSQSDELQSINIAPSFQRNILNQTIRLHLYSSNYAPFRV